MQAFEHDPGISRYSVNDQDRVRRRYIEMGSCQPKNHKFELLLILLVVERVFSSMNYVKNKLRNKMSDHYLNNCMVTFVEREFFKEVKDEDVIKLFQQGSHKVIL